MSPLCLCSDAINFNNILRLFLAIPSDLFLSDTLELIMYAFFSCRDGSIYISVIDFSLINPYPTAFPYGNGMVLHFY